MSKFAVRGIVAAVLAVATSAGFTAQETSTLSVTARIQGGCVLSTSGPMAFGDLNMAATSGSEKKEVIATYKCATGQTVSSFTVGGEAGGTFSGAISSGNSGSADTIPYTITWTNPGTYAGQGFSSAGKSVTLTGTILNGDYISKPPGNYAGAVLLAINY
jgi:hypothetical protein